MIHLVLVAKIVGGVAAVAAAGYGVKKAVERHRQHVEECDEAMTTPQNIIEFTAHNMSSWGKDTACKFKSSVNEIYSQAFGSKSEKCTQ